MRLMLTTAIPSSRHSHASGYWVMLMTSQPASLNHFDSDFVEKRGPWMTTTVPRSWTSMPWSRMVSMASWRRTGSYGSADERWVTIGPSKNVSARPLVRSTNWSHTTKSPGRTGSDSEPAAHGEMAAFTPSAFIAHTFAR